MPRLSNLFSLRVFAVVGLCLAFFSTPSVKAADLTGKDSEQHAVNVITQYAKTGLTTDATARIFRKGFKEHSTEEVEWN